MWTKENGARYDRWGFRYPSDLTDEGWAALAPLIPRAKRGGCTDARYGSGASLQAAGAGSFTTMSYEEMRSINPAARPRHG